LLAVWCAWGALMNFCTESRLLLAIALGLAITLSGCGYENTFKAEQAKTSFVGMSELELESCVGLPDKEATKGKTTLLVYNAPNATTINLSVPIVNGLGVSMAGYCRATFRLENGRVTSVSYNGDSDPLEGEDSACGALVRGCRSGRG
jgi:hypothetical protein